MKAKVPLTKAEEDRFEGSRKHTELSGQRPDLGSADLGDEIELQPVVLRLTGLPEATEQATDDKLGFLDGKS